MKKVLIGLLVLVLLLGGGVYYVFSNLDEIVRVAIERAGTDALGSSVQVGSVELDLLGGTAAIYNFSVANPEGFSDEDMLSFEELSVSIDINSLNGEMMRINSIVARNPAVFFESQSSTSNFDALTERFSGAEEAEAPESSADAPEIAIDSILIEDIEATLQSDLLTEAMNVNLGDIVLSNLEGTPEEIASQIMQPVITQLSAAAANALLSALAGVDLEELEDLARDRVDDELEQLEAEANAEIDEALGEELGNGLRGLLR